MATELGVDPKAIRFIHHAGFVTVDEFERGELSFYRGKVLLTGEELCLLDDEDGSENRQSVYRIPLSEIDGVGAHPTQLQIRHHGKLTILRMYEFSRYTLSPSGADDLQDALVMAYGLPKFQVTETYGLSGKHRPNPVSYRPRTGAKISRYEQ